MQTGDFDYSLPEERIAQTPAEPRDTSRLLVLNRNRLDGQLEHRTFRDLTEYLRPGDLMVFNRSRVIPARLYGTESHSGARVEVLLVRRQEPGIWQALGRPGRRLRAGALVTIEAHDGSAGAQVEVLASQENGLRLVRVSDESALDTLGELPLPPYIKEAPDDPDRYQTVYADTPGSVAAPTAGLHFTEALLDLIRSKGVSTAWVTLHVGLDTFRPVHGENIASARFTPSGSSYPRTRRMQSTRRDGATTASSPSEPPPSAPWSTWRETPMLTERQRFKRPRATLTCSSYPGISSAWWTP